MSAAGGLPPLPPGAAARRTAGDLPPLPLGEGGGEGPSCPQTPAPDPQTPAAAPRLFVFLARRAPIGVILRRGPARWIRLSVWHTDRDEIVPGQWFRGRIYEDRCDLSPDGSLFLYFARKDSAAARVGGYGHAWSALSRPPFVTALALWPQGSTYLGGGVFLDDRTIVLNGCTPDSHPDHRPRRGLRVRRVRRLVSGWSYQERLLRDGWERVAGDPPPGLIWPSVARPPSTWRRPNQTGTHVIVMDYPVEPSVPSICPADRLPTGFGGYPVRLAVARRAGGAITPLTGVNWAEWDHRGRLILSQDGRLYAADPDHADPGTWRAIADFRSESPDPQPAPAWAAAWPQPSRR